MLNQDLFNNPYDKLHKHNSKHNGNNKTMYSITAAQEQILLDLIKEKRPETWTDEELNLVIASSRCNDWQDMQGDLQDTIQEHYWYDEQREQEREQRTVNRDFEKYGHPSLSARERNNGRFN